MACVGSTDILFGYVLGESFLCTVLRRETPTWPRFGHLRGRVSSSFSICRTWLLAARKGRFKIERAPLYHTFVVPQTTDLKDAMQFMTSVSHGLRAEWPYLAVMEEAVCRLVIVKNQHNLKGKSMIKLKNPMGKTGTWNRSLSRNLINEPIISPGILYCRCCWGQVYRYENMLPGILVDVLCSGTMMIHR